MTNPNPYLDAYRAAAEHQGKFDQLFGLFQGQPNLHCHHCLTASVMGGYLEDPRRHFAWAIPTDQAIARIAAHSPNGVVEIGAGGGYWAMMLRAAGVDVIAYDPDPVGGHDTEAGWHDGTRWSPVLEGDHRKAADHPDRTLLLVWPSYAQRWTDEVLDHYQGQTVVYVGEGPGGCTGTDRMHALLGDPSGCWHDDDEDCDCGPTEDARFKQVDAVALPQWAGLHDALYICTRVVDVVPVGPPSHHQTIPATTPTQEESPS